MAVFVDLDDESDPPQDLLHGKPIWNGVAGGGHPRQPHSSPPNAADAGTTDKGKGIQENPNWNSTTEALGCYPIIVAIASSLDLNSLDSLSRTCRQVRAGLLQYRSVLVKSSLRCVSEALPVDPEQTLRYRARAGNWFYMEDTSRTNFGGKPGSCAQDLVGECRRCSVVICRNCAIKPPAPIVLRDRHRRLCSACTKAPLAELVKPPPYPWTPLSSDIMQSKICRCQSAGPYLCQPCGSSIRSSDHEYKGLWRWRGLYGEALGGLGTGIGEGDRGLQCGREGECHNAKECEHETDCEAADAAADNYFFAQQQQEPHGQPQGGPTSHLLHHHSSPPSSSSLGTRDSALVGSRRHTPSPGYARHEIEGIGGVVKTKLVRMVKVGAGVPEWEDEKTRGEILGREVAGRVRSWCGWCDRVIPGQDDIERDRLGQQRRATEFLHRSSGCDSTDHKVHFGAASAASRPLGASPTFSSSIALRLREQKKPQTKEIPYIFPINTGQTNATQKTPKKSSAKGKNVLL